LQTDGSVVWEVYNDDPNKCGFKTGKYEFLLFPETAMSVQFKHGSESVLVTYFLSRKIIRTGSSMLLPVRLNETFHTRFFDRFASSVIINRI